MALTATVHHFEVSLSDVDRGVYESLELRVARHPSESARYLWTRTLAYCLSYEEGIAFSKGGLSQFDEPPIAIRDATGILVAWIDIGSPSAERLHKASKASKRVELYTSADLALLRREAASRPVHKVEEIAVWRVEPSLLDALEPLLARSSKLELTRNEERLYVTIGASSFDTPIVCARLSP
jgi:uncharacterized protein YaeQ